MEASAHIDRWMERDSCDFVCSLGARPGSSEGAAASSEVNWSRRESSSAATGVSESAVAASAVRGALGS
eukprot:3154182-Pleurochrysis_carterae.AAC.1